MIRPKRNRVPKTRAGGEWTEAGFWQFLRSGFRGMSRRWPPIVRHALHAARRPYLGENKRQKWEYECCFCHQWFKGTEVKVDHITPAGRLVSWEDVEPFLRRLFVEKEELRVTCQPCHNLRHEEEKDADRTE